MIIFSIFAMMVAIGALWVASETSQRIKNGGAAALSPHVKQMKASVFRLHDTLKKMEHRLAKLERKVSVELSESLHREMMALPLIAQEVNDLQQDREFTPSSSMKSGRAH